MKGAAAHGDIRSPRPRSSLNHEQPTVVTCKRTGNTPNTEQIWQAHEHRTASTAVSPGAIYPQGTMKQRKHDTDQVGPSSPLTAPSSVHFFLTTNEETL